MAIIGTGISGLKVAIQLKQAGIPFVVIEKTPKSVAPVRKPLSRRAGGYLEPRLYASVQL